MAENKVKENCMERMKRVDGDRKIADFIVKQKQDYAFKRRYAQIRAQEFARECEARGWKYHVSVGGLDSITLFLFLKSIGINAPGITVSYLEDASIQRVHRALGLNRLQSTKREDGTPWTKLQPIYEEWLAEAVAKGRVKAPGFFTDPLRHKAYCKAAWNGPARGLLDPKKEAEAAVLRVENGFSTRSVETMEITGSDFYNNCEQLKNEEKALKEVKKIAGSEGKEKKQQEPAPAQPVQPGQQEQKEQGVHEQHGAGGQQEDEKQPAGGAEK